MNEKDLAAALQRSKDDATEWGDAAPEDSAAKPAKKRRLEAMVSVRLLPEELELVQQRAEELGQTVSAYLRSLAMRDATPGVRLSPFRFNVVSLSSAGTYLSRVENPLITVDGGRLQTYAT
jgi:hypothetical protein